MCLTVGSCFSGSGGFDLGLERAGMKVVWQCEVDPFRRRVLKAHWPDVECFPDVREFRADGLQAREVGANGHRAADTERGAKLPGHAVDLICGGFPCQDLSVAGRRAGLSGSRSGLFWEFARIVGEVRPTWVLIENVPGLLSSNGGRDFELVLGALGELGYGVAYRILDSRYFGVPQRRRRVFIVGHSSGRCDYPAAVLFEPEGSGGDTQAGRTPGEDVAAPLGASTSSFGGQRYDRDNETYVSASVTAKWRKGSGGPAGDEVQNLVAAPLEAADGHHGRSPPRGDGADNLVTADSLTVGANQYSGFQGEPVVSVRMAQTGSNGWGVSEDVTHTLDGTGGDAVMAIAQNQRGELREMSVSSQLTGGGGKPGEGYAAIREAQTVRRLLPVECELLQGFPPGWTDIEGAKDGPRYAAMGDAVSVPVIQWIGERIMRVGAQQ